MAGDKKVRPGGLKIPANPKLSDRYRKQTLDPRKICSYKESLEKRPEKSQLSKQCLYLSSE